MCRKVHLPKSEGDIPPFWVAHFSGYIGNYYLDGPSKYITINFPYTLQECRLVLLMSRITTRTLRPRCGSRRTFWWCHGPVGMGMANWGDFMRQNGFISDLGLISAIIYIYTYCICVCSVCVWSYIYVKQYQTYYSWMDYVDLTSQVVLFQLFSE